MKYQFVPYQEICGGRYRGCSIEAAFPGAEYRIYDKWDRLISSENVDLDCCFESIDEFLAEQQRKVEGY